MTDTSEILFPTERELLQYSRGKLASWRRVELELLASQNEFVADAMDGFAVYNVHLHRKKIWKKIGVAMGGLLVLVMTIGLFRMNEEPMLSEEPFKAMESATPATQAEKVALDGAVEPEQGQVMTYKKRISKVQTGGNKTERKEDVSLIQKKEKGELDVSGPQLELKKLRANVESRKIAWIHGVLFYIAPLAEKESNDLPYGLDASVENAERESDTFRALLEQEEATYDAELLSVYNDISLFVSIRNWLGLKEFISTVGLGYRDDVNIVFYQALAYYHLGDWSHAEELLLGLKYKGLSGFEEEVYYYYALSIYQGSNPEEGRRMLEEIARGDGFYSRQASSVLTE